MVGAVIELGDADLDRVVRETDGPVIVDFWAPWCAPCRAVAPILDEFAAEYPGTLIAKVNADENAASALAAGVVSIPTMQVYLNGQLVKSITGAKPKPMLQAELADYLR